jgi:hypothetical protein
VDGFILENWELKEYFKEQDIANCSDGELNKDDIILMPCKYDYGCGKDFPIDKMSFYKNGLNLDLI